MSCQLLIVSFAVLAAAAAAQTGPTEDTALLSPSPPSGSMTVSFRPSVAIVIGIFVIMFSLTFLLLMYAKFCHPAASLFASRGLHPDDAAVGNGGLRSSSGIDKTVIESLPFFRFSALRGDRGGLECAVCLSRYDDAELLRLLPGCRHAFHLECIDRWLDAHSSCPLCRTKIAAADAARLNQSGRFDSGRDLLGLFVEREPDAAGDLRRSSSRFSVGSSFRRNAAAAAAASVTSPAKFSSNNNYCTLREAADDEGGSEEMFDKFKHKIVVSDVVFQSRWSDVNSADLIALSSDMLRVSCSQRFEPIAPVARAPAGESVLKIREEMERKRLLESKATKMSRAGVGISALPSDGWNSTAVISPGGRSMSEITNVSRFRRVRDPAGSSAEEKVQRLWLPIVRRTVHWFAGREQRPPPPPPPPELRSVHSKEVTDLAAIV